jgi:hypothetical protein
VHLLEQQAPDEGVDVLQLQNIVVDAPLVRVLRQILRCRGPERALGAESVEPGFANLIGSLREELERLAEVACSSAFANSRSSDLLVDMPDPTALGETRRLSISDGLFLSD